MMRLGLDIDDVIADFDRALINFARSIGRGEVVPASPANIQEYNWFPKSGEGSDVWERAKESTWFWFNIEPCYLTLGTLQPVCYITSRPKHTQLISERWLWKHKMPFAPVFTVEHPDDKLEVAKTWSLTHFIDDKPETVKAFQDAGIAAYLYDQPHNRKSPVAPRLYSLEGLIKGTQKLGEGING